MYDAIVTNNNNNNNNNDNNDNNNNKSILLLIFLVFNKTLINLINWLNASLYEILPIALTSYKVIL